MGMSLGMFIIFSRTKDTENHPIPLLHQENQITKHIQEREEKKSFMILYWSKVSISHPFILPFQTNNDLIIPKLSHVD